VTPDLRRYLVGLRDLSDWQARLADPARHWRAGYSARMLAERWTSGADLPPEVAALMDPPTTLLYAIPEYGVPVPGRGADSQCDLLALVRSGGHIGVVAVEGKVDEPFGPTVGDWLADGGANRRDRLLGLCGLLDCGADPPPDLRYQLFHRTAAAVVEARRIGASLAAAIVHSFSPTHRWLADFEAFAAYLGQQATRGTATDRQLSDGLTLRLGWASDPSAGKET
jgi:hypothetical protein